MTEGLQTTHSEVHSQPERIHDGSRTSPEVQYEIMRRHRLGMCLKDICHDLHGKDSHADPRTVKAVIENWGNSLYRLRLEANKGKLVDAVLLSWDEAAKRGKSDSLKAWTDSFGITEPVKGAQGPQIAVQVNLHGGPEPVSLAKVEIESESGQDQAHIGQGPIISLMNTTQVLEAEVVSAPSVSQPAAEGQPATFVADSEKQARK